MDLIIQLVAVGLIYGAIKLERCAKPEESTLTDTNFAVFVGQAILVAASLIMYGNNPISL